jgi:hypothetical protein
MLLPKDINPSNTTYYNGAITIETLNTYNSRDVDFFELYRKLKLTNELSFQSYLLALDWLYLIGSIKLKGEGKIEKCF